MNSPAEYDDRIANERDFHNDRFSEEVRDAQGKYYAAIKDGSAHFSDRVLELAKGKDVLEYGCGSAIQGIQISQNARSLTGIDISDVAVKDAEKSASDNGLTNTKYCVMNAEQMTFEPNSFDLIFGRGIIHHLDLEMSFDSIARVLRPGGTAVFWEPLGHNPILNGYRNATPEARTPDEHPLLKQDFEFASTRFDLSNLRFYGLTTLLSVPVRDTALGDAMLKVTGLVDRLLFKTPCRWLAWHVHMEMRAPT